MLTLFRSEAGAHLRRFMMSTLLPRAFFFEDLWREGHEGFPIRRVLPGRMEEGGSQIRHLMREGIYAVPTSHVNVGQESHRGLRDGRGQGVPHMGHQQSDRGGGPVAGGVGGGAQDPRRAAFAQEEGVIAV